MCVVRADAEAAKLRLLFVTADPPALAFGQTMVGETWELDLAGRQGAAHRSFA